MKFFKRSSL